MKVRGTRWWGNHEEEEAALPVYVLNKVFSFKLISSYYVEIIFQDGH